MDDVALNQTYAHALARIFVRPLLGTWVRPNHLTALRLIVGLAACALLAVGSRTTAAWSGVLWIVTCVLDRADGELARMGDLRSESGKVLDYYSDMILDALWFLAAGLGLPVAGIDLRRTPSGRWYCFEVNPSPGFSYYEHATGQPLALSIARLLMQASPS